MRRIVWILAVVAAGCSSLGPPVQGARTGDKIVRATEPMTLGRVAAIAWGDSSLAPSVAVLARMQPDEVVPEGTVLVLPTRERLEARLREAHEFAAARGPAGGPPAASRPAVSTKERRDAAALFERGVAALAENRADDALREWERAWEQDPGYPDLAKHLNTEYRVRGLEAFSRGELETAIELWKKALRIDSSDGVTFKYLEHAREQLARSEEILGPGAPR